MGKNEEKELLVTLKVDENTDVRLNLRSPHKDEKVIKVSNPYKIKVLWFVSFFFEKPRRYYKFLCLTTDRLSPATASQTPSRNWEIEYDNSFTIYNCNLVSAYARKIRGRNWLFINYEYLDGTRQIKFLADTPDEWVKEINAVIEKQHKA